MHTCLVGDTLVEGRAREGRVGGRKEEEKDRLVRSFHITLLSVKLLQAVSCSTNREGMRVFYRGASAQRPGNQLQISSKKNSLTCMYPL